MCKCKMVTLAVALVVAGCGGGPKTGPAAKLDARETIQKGVAFLAGAQNPDGSYGEQLSGVGITAIAAVAIATAPQELPEPEQQALERAVAYILRFVQPDGAIHNKQLGYEHYRTSLAIMALSAIDPDKHKQAIARARSYLLGSQFSETNGNFTTKDWQYGGWRYGKEKGEPKPDLSNTHFVIAALHDSGLPKDSEAFKRAVHFLQRCQSRTESNDMQQIGNDGGAIYSPISSKAEFVELADGTKVYKSYGSMTYALLKSYIFCNVSKDDPRLKAAYKWIQQHYTVEENPNLGQQGLYYNYLTMARALEAYGSPTLKTPDGVEHAWAQELAAKLASLQQPDGSWLNEQDRWYEGDKALVTGYAVWTLNICHEAMRK